MHRVQADRPPEIEKHLHTEHALVLRAHNVHLHRKEFRNDRVKSETSENTAHTHTHTHSRTPITTRQDFGGNNKKQTKRNRTKTMCALLSLFLSASSAFFLFCFALFSKIKAHYFLSLIDINLVVRCAVTLALI